MECFWWVNAKQTKLSQSGGCNSLAYSVSAEIKWKNGLMRMDLVIFSDLLCKELSLCSVAEQLAFLTEFAFYFVNISVYLKGA